jgi:hypothetical protein
MVSFQARSRPRAAGTHAAVLFVGWPSSNGTIVASPRLRRVVVVASFRCVSSSSSNPSPCWLRPDTVEQRPLTRSYRRRSRTLCQGSVEARRRFGNSERHDLRDAQPSALGYPTTLVLLSVPAKARNSIRFLPAARWVRFSRW